MPLQATVQYLHPGGVGQYPFNFVGGYLDPSHILVDTRVAGVTTTAVATLQGSGTALITAPAGATLTIRRSTPKTALADFVTGTPISEASLDTVARQALLVIGELADLRELSSEPDLALYALLTDLTGYAKVVGGNNFQGAQAVAFASLVDGATITPNASASNHFRVTLAGNRTLANPTNLVDGVILNFWIKQDATGSRTLAYGSKFKWPGGTAPTLTTAAGSLDLVIAQYNAALDMLACSITKDVR